MESNRVSSRLIAHVRKCFCGLLLAACSCISPGGSGGLLFNSYGGPLQATANPSGKKTGSASVSCYLGLVCLGDAGIAAAAKNGGIEKVGAVDYRYTSVLAVIYTRTTITVTGD